MYYETRIEYFEVFSPSHSGLFDDESVVDQLKKTLSFACCVIVSPVGQVAQIIKAVAGIIYPGFYFKEPDVMMETIYTLTISITTTITLMLLPETI